MIKEKEKKKEKKEREKKVAMNVLSSVIQSDYARVSGYLWTMSELLSAVIGLEITGENAAQTVLSENVNSRFLLHHGVERIISIHPFGMDVCP